MGELTVTTHSIANVAVSVAVSAQYTNVTSSQPLSQRFPRPLGWCSLPFPKNHTPALDPSDLEPRHFDPAVLTPFFFPNLGMYGNGNGDGDGVGGDGDGSGGDGGDNDGGGGDDDDNDNIGERRRGEKFFDHDDIKSW